MRSPINNCHKCICADCAKVHCIKHPVQLGFQRCLDCLLADEAPELTCADFREEAPQEEKQQSESRSLDDKVEEILVRLDKLDQKKKRRRRRR